MMNAKWIVPKLRFTEFDNNWDTVKLGDLIKKGKAGGTPKSSNPDYYNGNIPFLSIKDMTSQGKYINYTEKTITEEGLDNSSAWIVPKHSLLYSIYASVGFVAINCKDIATSQAIYGMILKDNVSLEYMYYYLTYYKKNLHKLIETGTQGNLNAKTVKNFDINIPDNNEQNKIASFLKIIDEKIILLNKKHNCYLNFKTSIINKLFSGQIQFDGFDNNWDSVKLGDLIKKGKAGGTPKSSNPDYYNGNIPFLSIKDMTSQGKYINYTEKTITEEGLDNSSAWIVPKHSLLYSIYASVGFVAINCKDIATSQAIYGMILKDNVSLEYMYYYLTYYKKNLHKLIETGTQGNLNAKTVKNFDISIPSLEEQELIVKYLSLIDVKIELLRIEIDKLSKFKLSLFEQILV